MQILIATALLVALGVYLLVQFWSNALEEDDSRSTLETPALPSHDDGSERLKAA